MANFFTDLIKKILPDTWEYKMGITKEPVATFEVGAGLTSEQKTQAETKLQQVAEGGKTLPDKGLSIAQSAEFLSLGTIASKKGQLTPELAQIQKEASEELAWQGIMWGPIGMGGEMAKGFAAGTKAIKTTKAATKTIQQTAKEVGEELAKVKGTKLTYNEVVDAAKTSDLLRKVTTREETLAREAQVLKTQQQVAAMAEKGELTQEFVNGIKAISTEATSLGRRLNALKIEALPEMAQFKGQVVKKLVDLGYKTDEVLKAAQGIDMTNADQVAKFYRKFVKPNWGEIVDEIRYINLLSSPKTHIVNTFTNLLQTTTLAPATRLFSGGFDLIASSLTGKTRSVYVRETPVYVKGMISSLNTAISDTFAVIKGTRGVYRPDISRIPTKLKVLAPFQMIPKLMEASDVFFRTLITGGEKEALAYRAFRQGKQPTITLLADIEKQAADKAQYYVFRKTLDPSNKTGQGVILSAIDNVTKALYSLRGRQATGKGILNPVKWFAPFVTTPMNILKQGLEFSPLGATTLISAANKTEQLAKTFIGSMVFTGAGIIAMRGDSTWSVPTDEKAKKLFYASGKQPYALRIGNYWISYSRLGPLAYPFAMAAGIKYYTDQNPQSVTDTALEKTTKIISGIGGFFADQSYVQGMGDLLDILRGDVYAAGRMMGNLPAQMIPLSSFQRWVNTIIDNTYRETEKGATVQAIIDNLKQSIVGLSKTLPPYKAPFGEVSKRDSPIINALSPLGISINKQDMENLYELLMESRTQNAEIRKIKEDLRKELGL